MISRVKSLGAESTWRVTDDDQSGRMSWYTSSLDPCETTKDIVAQAEAAITYERVL